MNIDEKLNALRDAYEGTTTCARCGCALLGFCAMNWKDEWYCHYCWFWAKRAKVAKTASKAPSDGRVSELESMRKNYEAMHLACKYWKKAALKDVKDVEALRKERDALQEELNRVTTQTEDVKL